MIIGYTTTIDAYRARTFASPPIVLRKRKCACGKQVNAKQLAQYGACVGCYRAHVKRSRDVAAQEHFEQAHQEARTTTETKELIPA